MFRRLQSCNNVEDMRQLAKQRLPGPTKPAASPIPARSLRDVEPEVNLFLKELSGMEVEDRT